LFLLFDLNEDGKWDVQEMLGFATWRHVLSQEAGNKLGESTQSITIGSWETMIVHEGFVFWHQETGALINFKEKTTGFLDSIVSESFSIMDFDETLCVSAIEFAAMLFTLRYAQMPEWTVQRREFANLLYPEGQLVRCDRVCQLFSIYHAAFAVNPNIISDKQKELQAADPEKALYIDGHLGASNAMYAIYHLFYASVKGSSMAPGRAKTRAERERAYVHVNGRVVVFHEWVGAWWFASAGNNGMYPNYQESLKDVICEAATPGCRKLYWVQFRSLLKDHCGSKLPGKDEEGLTRWMISRSKYAGDIVTRNDAHLLFALLDRLSEGIITIAGLTYDVESFFQKFFIDTPDEVKGDKLFGRFFERDQAAGSGKNDMLPSPPDQPKINFAEVLLTQCEGQMRQFQILLFDLIARPHNGAGEVEGFIGFTFFMNFVKFLAMGNGMQVFYGEDWKDFTESSLGELVIEGRDPSKFDLGTPIIDATGYGPLGRTVAEFITFMVTNEPIINSDIDLSDDVISLAAKQGLKKILEDADKGTYEAKAEANAVAAKVEANAAMNADEASKVTHSDPTDVNKNVVVQPSQPQSTSQKDGAQDTSEKMVSAVTENGISKNDINGKVILPSEDASGKKIAPASKSRSATQSTPCVLHNSVTLKTDGDEDTKGNGEIKAVNKEKKLCFTVFWHSDSSTHDYASGELMKTQSNGEKTECYI